MLYNLLYPFAADWSLLNLFKYITFRTGGAALTALIFCLLAGRPFIAWLRARQGAGQPIRTDGPETHLKKKGTPTMGGLMVMVAVALSSVLWSDLRNPYLWLALFVFIGFGMIGFADDYAKLTRASHRGISGRMRLGLEAAFALIAVFGVTILMASPMGTSVAFPFFKHFMIDLGWFFLPFGAFVIVGAANAVNFTDGLDGLAIGPIMIAAGCFGIISYIVGHAVYAPYLQVPSVPGAGELAVFCGALVGAGLGFLWFNAPPAEVFMGDTGSLSMGGALGLVAVVSKHEIVLAIIGGLFVIETLSVILQVASFKLRGKRVFLMAPLHHHFEKAGWAETKVVMRFWIVAIVFALIGLSTLKLR